jgi:hypothetical protein
MKLKKIMLSLGVGILSALFIGFLIEAVYPSPDYYDYCKRQFDIPQPQVKNQELCNYTIDPVFRTKCVDDQGMIEREYDANGCVVKETCNYCEKEFKETSEKYNRNLFYITAPIGLLLILLGLYLPSSIDAIAGGILLGGILTMIQITVRIFGDLGRWPRVILLGLELFIVVWIGIKKVHEGVIKKTKKK